MGIGLLSLYSIHSGNHNVFLRQYDFDSRIGTKRRLLLSMQRIWSLLDNVLA
jgi:hypothetical protein